MLKIEDMKGLEYVATQFEKDERTTLLAARGDLYVEIDRPHNIMAALKLIIAITDNISDTLGIHIYQEAENPRETRLWLFTFNNFLIRFLLSMAFIVFVILLPLAWAIALSIIFGLIVIGIISYQIAVHHKENILRAVASHLAITLIVIIISGFLSAWISAEKFLK